MTTPTEQPTPSTRLAYAGCPMPLRCPEPCDTCTGVARNVAAELGQILRERYGGSSQVADWLDGFTHTADADLIARARTALAQPEPEGLPPGYIDAEHAGCDREMLETFYTACRSEGGTADEIHLRGIRAALARFARPAIKPVPVAERPWEREGWCDAEGRCWWGKLRRFQPENCFVYAWGLASPGRLDTSTVCLPHHAMTIPTP